MANGHEWMMSESLAAGPEACYEHKSARRCHNAETPFSGGCFFFICMYYFRDTCKVGCVLKSATALSFQREIGGSWWGFLFKGLFHLRSVKQ